MISLSSRIIVVLALCLFAGRVASAEVNFVRISKVLSQPAQVGSVEEFALNLASYPADRVPAGIAVEGFNDGWVYLARVLIGKQPYDRLVAGNFSSLEQARARLRQVKQDYPGAWINRRSKAEIGALNRLSSGSRSVIGGSTAGQKPRVPVKQPVPRRSIDSRTLTRVQSLIQEAEQKLIDGENARVIVLAGKIGEIGDAEQQQQAMELAGLARERQGKFAQAVKIYREFLARWGDGERAEKINSRLQGLLTMREQPREKLDEAIGRRSREWSIFGALSQYYRNDVVDLGAAGSEEVNSSLLTDINLFARSKTDTSALAFRFDGGMVNDFTDSENDFRISRAMLTWSDASGDMQLLGGRQNRSAQGVLGRFDGLVFKHMTPSSFDYSVYFGYPVLSAFDSVATERRFVGASIRVEPLAELDLDFYLLQQENEGLTDRQAIGSEIQYRNERGFLFGLIDYDTFYQDLNNLTAIGNYRVEDAWALNLTYHFRNSPLLSTLNALQGQPVTSMQELQELFSDDEIYQLAQDRTSKSHYLMLSSNQQFDDRRSLFLSLSLSAIEETVASGGVPAIPSTDDIHLAADYTIRGFFQPDDYSTAGLRLSDTFSASIISLRGRVRFAASRGWGYDPRIRVDYRHGKNDDVDQWIVAPTFKLTYRTRNKVSLEASLGIEYSNFDLPEQDDQIAYNLLLGYVYPF